jgi:hypothetical protein
MRLPFRMNDPESTERKTVEHKRAILLSRLSPCEIRPPNVSSLLSSLIVVVNSMWSEITTFE